MSLNCEVTRKSVASLDLQLETLSIEDKFLDIPNPRYDRVDRGAKMLACVALLRCFAMYYPSAMLNKFSVCQFPLKSFRDVHVLLQMIK